VKQYNQILPIKIKQDLKIIASLIESEIKGFSMDNLKQIFSINNNLSNRDIPHYYRLF